MARDTQAVTVQGFEGFEEFLKDFMKRGNQPSLSVANWEATRDTLEEIHARYFQSERGPDGQAWKENATYTKQRKGHSRILRGIPEEGFELSRSLTESSAQHSVREYNARDMIFGTRRPWAWTHQEAAGVPKRVHTGLTEEGLEDVMDVVAEAVVDHMFEIR